MKISMLLRSARSASGRRGAKCSSSRHSLALRGSGCVGSRWQPVGEMAEDFDNHRRIFDAGPEHVKGAVMIFRLPPRSGRVQCRVEDPFEQACLTQARRRALRVDVRMSALKGPIVASIRYMRN